MGGDAAVQRRHHYCVPCTVWHSCRDLLMPRACRRGGRSTAPAECGYHRPAPMTCAASPAAAPARGALHANEPSVRSWANTDGQGPNYSAWSNSSCRVFERRAWPGGVAARACRSPSPTTLHMLPARPRPAPRPSSSASAGRRPSKGASLPLCSTDTAARKGRAEGRAGMLIHGKHAAATSGGASQLARLQPSAALPCPGSALLHNWAVQVATTSCCPQRSRLPMACESAAEITRMRHACQLQIGTTAVLHMGRIPGG